MNRYLPIFALLLIAVLIAVQLLSSNQEIDLLAHSDKGEGTTSPEALLGDTSLGRSIPNVVIDVHVVSEKGKGISGAKLSGDGKVWLTSRDGRADLEVSGGLTDLGLSFEVSASGYLGRTVRLRRKGGKQEIVLQAMTLVHGVVFDVHTELPVQGALVRYAHEDRVLASTNADGRFSGVPVSFSGDTELIFSKLGFVSEVVQAYPSSGDGLRIAFYPGLLVAGKVVKQDGSPIESATLTENFNSSTQTDEQGLFDEYVKCDSGGKGLLSVVAAGFRSLLFELNVASLSATPEDGSEPELQVMTMLESATLQGEVAFVDGGLFGNGVVRLVEDLEIVSALGREYFKGHPIGARWLDNRARSGYSVDDGKFMVPQVTPWLQFVTLEFTSALSGEKTSFKIERPLEPGENRIVRCELPLSDGGGGDTGHITGKVRLNGDFIEWGAVNWKHTETGEVGGCTIKDGAFEAAVRPGAISLSLVVYDKNGVNVSAALAGDSNERNVMVTAGMNLFELFAFEVHMEDVRGRVVDNLSRLPMPNVPMIIGAGACSVKGASDHLGEFSIQVPVGPVYEAMAYVDGHVTIVGGIRAGESVVLEIGARTELSFDVYDELGSERISSQVWWRKLGAPYWTQLTKSGSKGNPLGVQGNAISGKIEAFVVPDKASFSVVRLDSIDTRQERGTRKVLLSPGVVVRVEFGQGASPKGAYYLLKRGELKDLNRVAHNSAGDIQEWSNTLFPGCVLNRRAITFAASGVGELHGLEEGGYCIVDRNLKEIQPGMTYAVIPGQVNTINLDSKE